MAKITVAGEAIIIQSSMKLEEIKLIAKHRPKALILAENEETQVFRIGIAGGESTGSLNKYGAEFANVSNNEDGFARITIVERIDVLEDVKEFITNKYGQALSNLNKLEETLPRVVVEIQNEREMIFNQIEIL